MEWITRYGTKRAQYWPEVEACFGALPPELFRQGILLRHNLASLYSDTGQFADILSRLTDPPWLYLHFWLLDDWGFPEGQARQALERRLFLAMVATFCAVGVRESILSEDAGFDSSARRLEQTLHQAAAAHLSRLFPHTSPFWGYHRRFMDASAEALVRPPDWAEATPPFEDAYRRMANRLAFTKIPAVAVALCAREASASRLPALLDCLDWLNASLQLLRETLAIRRDAHRGHLSYPIVKTMREAGIAFGALALPERLLGAMFLSGSIYRLAQEGLVWLARCQTSTRELQLPTLAAYISTLEDQFHELMDLFSTSGLKTGAQRSAPPRLSFAAAQDGLSQAIAMAEGYLLADRTFSESWEVQRRRVFGAPELIGGVFAPGLILEVLCQYREDVANQVSAVLDRMAEDGFRYYPHPAVPPDADDLGLALRLYPHSAEKAKHQEQLQRPLAWMKANTSETGQIPCWFTHGVEGFDATYKTSLWGNQCATVEANLLLGLMTYASAEYHAVVERSAAQWLRRWMASGLGANALYIPSYALWTALKLVNALSASAVERSLQGQLDRVRESLAERLQKEADRSATPQEAAFLTLTCLDQRASLPVAALFDPDWIGLILKRQRYDGSWAGEPLFVTPTRGDVATWYSSNSVTTAYCCHALKRYAQSRKTGL